MEKENKLTKKQAAELKKLPLSFEKQDKQTTAKTAPYFYDEAVKEIARLLHLTPEQAETGGYNVFTTLNPRLQKLPRTRSNARLIRHLTFRQGLQRSIRPTAAFSRLSEDAITKKARLTA